jgi:putative phage-type endonuclease
MSVLDIPTQRVAELVTPTGVLVSTAEPQTDEWFAVRRQGISATDLPKILGLSQYGDARSVWHDKLGELPPDPAGEAATWGNLLEDVVAQEWARRHSAIVSRVGVVAHAKQPWRRAALDRILDQCPDGAEACGLEVKTRSAFTAGRWRQDMPDDVLAQVAWQRMTSGYGHIHVAALIGGQRMVEFTYWSDPDLEAFLLKEASTLWGQVQSGEIPHVEPTQILADMLDRMFPDRDGEIDIPREKALDLVAAYQHAQSLDQEAAGAKEAARAAVIDALGAGETLTAEGQKFFTYREQTKTSINVTDLENNDVELYEAVLSGGHINEKTSRVLRLAYKGESE